jgi:hypothetical protein
MICLVDDDLTYKCFFLGFMPDNLVDCFFFKWEENRFDKQYFLVSTTQYHHPFLELHHKNNISKTHIDQEGSIVPPPPPILIMMTTLHQRTIKKQKILCWGGLPGMPLSVNCEADFGSIKMPTEFNQNRINSATATSSYQRKFKISKSLA